MQQDIVTLKTQGSREIAALVADMMASGEALWENYLQQLPKDGVFEAQGAYERAVSTLLNASTRLLKSATSGLVYAAARAGAQDAGSDWNGVVFEDQLTAPGASTLDSVATALRIDAITAARTARQVGQRYQLATWRGVGTEEALATALRESLGGDNFSDVFVQLDRANRRFKTSQMLPIQVCMAMRTAYAEQFFQELARAGADEFNLQHPEHPTRRMSYLKDWPAAAREELHPNARWRLTR